MIASFHRVGYGLRSQLATKAMAKKMAKSMVGKSMVDADGAQPSVLGHPLRGTWRRARPDPQRASPPGRPPTRPTAAALRGLQGLDQGREHLVDVPHDAEVGHREDRGVLVLV